MKAAERYGAFAYAYDQALGERYFRAVRRLLVDVLERYPSETKTHLDVACGTGLAMPFFAGRGFVTTGVDLSPVMLNVARKRAQRLVAGDTRALPLRAQFSRITCLYDALNHLLDPRDLGSAFGEIARVMDGDSLFLFDMNHPDVYPAVWGMKEPFIDEGRDFHLEIATTYRRRERLGRALVTGWAMVDGRCIAIRERHTQRSYERDEIVAALAAGGLAPIEVCEFDPWVEGRTIKLFFVCRVRARAATSRARRS
ncbi:MAG TPA: class I SAM-dependent methyltransferase [Thermoanaerobaculia bacterium]|nr:class I SAM-dependent methyltransferase [Thermoanaerobaculia bacterium]